MRTLEILLIVALAALLLSLYARRWSARLALTALAVLGLHLALERYRWQMVPAYALTALLALAALARTGVLQGNRPPVKAPSDRLDAQVTPARKRHRLLALFAGTFLLLAAAAPPVLFPDRTPLAPSPSIG
jgi:hypothetical protein